MAVWSTLLPQELLVRGYRETFRDNTVKSMMDVGPPKVRRRATAAAHVIHGFQVLTSTQLGTLRTFYQDTLNDGSTSFTWTHPSAGTTGVEVFFGRPPQVAALGDGDYEVSYEFIFKTST